ncbi:hypothetical protein [Chryseobacterium luteum]|uniref:Uncharacterized protein n=1 Tax=Chryseobacterium luteum TaxID=421531 RepID=A0A085ZVK8_9FLAO|nr:hypothetical protein [Chryseobacterium luteum]KFF08472.1 hypothetical protein IX38_06830 [Chryseobacterium luteum]
MTTKPTSETEIPGAVPDTNTITSELIQNLISNYRNNQMQAVNKELGITDAHSIWFDLPKLKKFISRIENEATNANPNISEEDLGIRFYYAAYPKAQDWTMMEDYPVDVEYAERHTLVMVPTLKKEDENGEMLDYDFSPSNNTKSLTMESKGGETPLIYTIAENHGTLSPPSDPKVEQFP